MAENKNNLNQSMLICEIIAACFVVFIHVLFPGNLGKIMDCSARFAVPFFFVISGYYSYRISSGKIKKRALNIFKIYIIANIIYFIVDCYKVDFDSQSVRELLKNLFSYKTFARNIFMCDSPSYQYFWYLLAILFCYIVFWFYTKFFPNKEVDYKPLYYVGFICFLFQIAFGLKAVGSGLDVYLTFYRNGLFFGIPMFSLGLFIREHQDRIIKQFNLDFKKEIGLIILGFFLSELQWFGIGKVELPIGSLIVTFSIMMMVITHPTLINNESVNNLLLYCKRAPLVIYIIHPLFKVIIHTEKIELFSKMLSNEYLFPICVLILSLISGVIISIIIQTFKIKLNKYYQTNRL